MNSDDTEFLSPEDQEAVAVQELVVKVKKAASLRLYYSEDSYSSSTVFFWASQVAGALKSSKQSAESRQQRAEEPQSASDEARGTTKMSLIKAEFLPFLLKILYNAFVVCLGRPQHYNTSPKYDTLNWMQSAKLGCRAPCTVSRLQGARLASVVLGDV